ncbi:MAG: TetR/AcrR family transcriptional regulator [Cyanobacteria bacterium P01_A01_bin.37]
MMSKAQETRSRIIEKSASLFNMQGYSGASMSDVMKVTGLKKGGIYNHFKSKDDLALTAFDFAAEQASRRYIDAVKKSRGAIAKLHAIIATFYTSIDELQIAGGCPLMNTAIESDDTHPALRDRVQQAMTRWRGLIARVVSQGIKTGEIRASVNPEAVATILISTLEGALMMTKLYGDRTYLEHAKTHLEEYLDESLST